ncbi:uncharacterized protein SAPINGB_P000794 [Magnusiomyces paraingens]|uniref:RRM domain-containing protein n=1 Tax=Magnusiomyces paraingens TaxID=2606893 RepID=A0A5E8B8H6_9ASCO|nr:uncharacterized protein SAPINGB_P000794 [Saprochaete ingens]VVT45567.1 unnamed protein product [Saprochaete ingens]
MSSNLDKSLDEIISSKPKSRGTKRRSSGRGVSKPSSSSSASTASKKKSNQQKASALPASTPKGPKTNILDEASKLSDRIIISNLPTDVTESAVRDYFSHEVGPITSCSISYNARGQSTGIVTITFKRPGDAHKASVRFNGTAIDNGAKRMKVELVMDPSKKPLSTRLNPLSTEAVHAAVSQAASNGGRKKKVPAARTKSTSSNGSSKNGSSAKKSNRRPKKTLEELDAEMEDYFDNKA